MSGFLTCALVVCVAVAAELTLPGRAIYHTAWFNVLLLAVVVGMGLSVRRLAGGVKTNVLALTLGVVGVAIVAATGIAFGLLAPDDGIAIGAPGATVHVDDLAGTLQFEPDGRVVYARGSARTVVPRAGWKLAGDFVLRSELRDDVAVDATDVRGGHLTITQPNGTTFLSQVLTMQRRQTFAGVALPFDTFAVPALHRSVYVVAFDAHQVAALLPTFDADGRSAIIFGVDDEAGRPVPGGNAMAHDGEQVAIAGLRLRATVTPYPAISYLAVPMPSMVALGLLIALLGAGWPRIAAALDARSRNG